jgi:S1-C subfamily serine protease
VANLPSDFRFADQRAAGAQCRHCNNEVRFGESIAVCPRCGGVNHEACWLKHDGCGSYECAPARRVWSTDDQPTMRITDADLAAAPLRPPRRGVPFSTMADAYSFAPTPSRTNGWAIASFVTAVAGILMFGVITGVVATVLGSIAIGGIQQSRQKGMWLALTGIFLGLFDVVGWVVFLAIVLSSPRTELSLSEFDPDPAALENMPAPINRAMRANVLIETQFGWNRSGIGSGVILRIAGGRAIIVTNRHVVDPNFSATAPARASVREDAGKLRVKLLGQLPQPGEVLWIAPDGIDLALVGVAAHTANATAAVWQEKPRLAIGDEVFTIGNPQHLDWSATRGVISQFRMQTCGATKVRVIQTDAAINPGNSGGGLYNKDGRLIAINTWTNDKRAAEGISFSIAFETLLKLNPPPLQTAADSKRKEGP